MHPPPGSPEKEGNFSQLQKQRPNGEENKREEKEYRGEKKK